MLRCALVPVAVTALDHDDTVVMAPATMQAIVAMLAEFGAGAVRAVMMALDHHRLSTCQRRRRNRERTQSGNDITKLLHDVLLQRNAIENGAYARTFRRNGRRILNGYSGSQRSLIAALLRRRRHVGLDVVAVPDRVLAALAPIVDCAQAQANLRPASPHSSCGLVRRTPCGRPPPARRRLRGSADATGSHSTAAGASLSGPCWSTIPVRD